MATRATLLGLALAVLAGCVSPFAPEDPAVTGATTRVTYLHSAMTLADLAEENVSVVRTGGFYQAWAEGEDYPTWAADPPARDVLVTHANVTLYVQTSGPVVESRRFPDIMVYGGAGDAWMGFGSRTDLVALRPGEVYEIEIELSFPQGGLWLSPDVGFGVKVVPVMLQQDERADVEILLGGENDTASLVEWTTLPVDVPPARDVARGNADGEVLGTIYAGPAAPPTTSHRTPLPVPPNATWILAWMNTTQNVGIPDLDLALVGPDGEAIASSGTPTPRDAIRVAGPNLRGPGGYGLDVTTAGSPRAEFRVEWLVGTG